MTELVHEIVCIHLSAKGHEQTCALQKGMFALPPIATAKADISKPSCLRHPRKQTCAMQRLMSAMGQKRTYPITRSQRLQSRAAPEKSQVQALGQLSNL